MDQIAIVGTARIEPIRTVGAQCIRLEQENFTLNPRRDETIFARRRAVKTLRKKGF